MAYYGYCLYDTSSPLTGTGTLATVFGSKLVNGTASAFDTQLAPGSLLFVGANVIAVTSIQDPLRLTLQLPAPAGYSGAFTYVNPTNVEDITPGIFPPKPTFQPWADKRDLGNGLMRAMGQPIGSWEWGYLTQGQRDALRAYCVGISNRVYLRTRGIDNLDAYLTYQAVIIWPDVENRVAFKSAKASREQFILQMRDMVLV